MDDSDTGTGTILDNDSAAVTVNDVTVAEVLKQAGYATAFCGKWGIGTPGTEGVPHKQGFDLAFGYYDQRRAHTFYPEFLYRNEEKIDLPQAFRSTFFWTQLPPVVDLHPDEPVGGNIVLLGSTGRFDIEANFKTGADKQGEPLQVRFTDIECGKTWAQP